MSHRSVIGRTKDSARPAAESPRPEHHCIAKRASSIEGGSDKCLAAFSVALLASPPSANARASACLVLGLLCPKGATGLLGTYKKNADQVRRKR